MLDRSLLCAFVLLNGFCAALLNGQKAAVWRDPSPHNVRFETVDHQVRLEVLDWGGSGPPLVLLTGLGGTAHGFDDFAPKLTGTNHVYGITRRGYGVSSAPLSGYGADRLGDDVVAVLDSLKLRRVVLVGESIGGEELSSVGTRYPSRVAGLVYLDAGYQYAFDDGKGSTIEELQGNPPPQPPPPGPTDLASFGALQAWTARIYGYNMPEAELRQSRNSTPDGRVGESRAPASIGQAVLAGMQKYTDIRVPALVIFAVPHDMGPWVNNQADPALRDAYAARETALVEKQAKAFENGVPSARVVRIPHANHLIFMSNERDVLREMRTFLSGLH